MEGPPESPRTSQHYHIEGIDYVKGNGNIVFSAYKVSFFFLSELEFGPILRCRQSIQTFLTESQPRVWFIKEEGVELSQLYRLRIIRRAYHT